MKTEIRMKVALGISVATSMMYEITLMNYLFYYFPQSSYSSSLVISVFLLGMGIGAYISYNLKNLGLKELGVLQASIGVYAFFALTRTVDILEATEGLGLWVVSIILLTPLSICLGTIFPLTTRLAKEDNEVGDMYAIDLLGGVAGTCLAGFVLIPTLGNVATIIIAACMNLATIPILLKKRVVGLAISMIILGAVVYTIMPVHTEQPQLVDRVKIGGVTYYVYEGGEVYKTNSEYGEVKIVNSNLYINNKGQCNINAYRENYGRISDLAKIINNHGSKKLLMIGLGCGITAGAVLSETDAEVTIVEINPKVIDANRKLTNLLDMANIQVIPVDGMRYLKDYGGVYDYILVEIEDPTAATSSGIYTKEGFELLKSKTSKEGLVSLFCYSRDQNSEFFSVLINTVRTSFAHVYYKDGIIWATDVDLGGEEARSIYPGVSTLDKNLLESLFAKGGA